MPNPNCCYHKNYNFFCLHYRFKLEEQSRLMHKTKDLDFREMRVKGKKMYCFSQKVVFTAHVMPWLEYPQYGMWYEFLNFI